MRALASRLAGALLILMLLLAPPAAHITLMVHRGMMLAGILIGVQAVLVTWIALSPIAGSPIAGSPIGGSSIARSPIARSSIARSSVALQVLRVVACGAVFLCVLFLARFTSGGPVAAAAVPHAMAYVALLALFGASLQPGREAVITVLARRSRGRLPSDIVRYTRRVTWAWCWFFLAQLGCSLTLLLFAPLGVWSLFINLCNLPLIGVMLCAEYVYRQWRHAARPPERLTDMVRIVRHLRTAPVGEDR
jgi:uncharacterized membrane protein